MNKQAYRAIQSQLHARVIQTYQPLQVKNAVNLVMDLLDDPSQHIDHAKRRVPFLFLFHFPPLTSSLLLVDTRRQ